MKNLLIFFFFIISWNANAQVQEQRANDPCGYPDTTSLSFRIAASGNWGYGYDTLKIDLQQWSKSPFVKVDSIGATVQQRTMFMLTIQDTAHSAVLRKRIIIHARTHPGEVQGTYVTNEIIKFLLTDTLVGKKLRDSCVFNIIPMYNPDGVELGYARENANKIDIESNWNYITPQPEVQVLRNTYTRLMKEPNRILVMLNMHSAYACQRYFVFHDSTGTTQLYAQQERKFINLVRNNFPNNIAPWNYYVSWVGTASKSYPESWFWYNYRDSVLALTYEDMNCTANGKYDSTAMAILNGVAEYLGVVKIPTAVFASSTTPEGFQLFQNYPNPFNPTTTIEFTVPSHGRATLKIYSILGQEIATLFDEIAGAGKYYRTKFDASTLATGIYFARLQFDNTMQIRKLLMVK